MLYRYWLWTSLSLLHLGVPYKAQAVCGEGLAETRQALVAEEAAFRSTEQVVRAARALMLSREADLRETLATPPSEYPEDVARRLNNLHRTEVALKLQMLDRLRARHEEARQQWERGHHLLHLQMAEARTAAQSDLLSQAEYCGVQERYVQALRLYQQGMQHYRTGMELYAKALDAYGVRFLIPYLRGFTDPQQWDTLITDLERGDFLQDFLVPLTVNAVRVSPPDAPP
jgi:exonuclease VII small subunit